jgi:hypothetical protein
MADDRAGAPRAVLLAAAVNANSFSIGNADGRAAGYGNRF